MSKYYDELEEFERKWIKGTITGRISSENDETIEIVDENSTKKPDLAYLMNKYQELGQKMAKKTQPEQKSLEFRHMYGSPKRRKENHEKTEDFGNLLNKLVNDKLAPELKYERRAKEPGKGNPNIVFRDRKRNKGAFLGIYSGCSIYGEEN